MFQTNIEIKTGRSSGSWGLGRSQYGKKRRKATHLRYNAGRTYYKNKKIWCCRECYADNHPSEAGFKSQRQIRNERAKREEEQKKKFKSSGEKAIKLIKLVKKYTNNNPKVFNQKNLSEINTSLSNITKAIENTTDYKKIDEAISNCKEIFYLNCQSFKTKTLFWFWNIPKKYLFYITLFLIYLWTNNS